METSSSISETPKEECVGGKERRRNYRHDCVGFAECWVSDPESLFRGEIRDISLTGCFIRTAARLNLRQSTAVDLRFTLKNSHFRVSARVMDIRQGKGVGMEFIFPGSQPPEWLKNLIKELSLAPLSPRKSV
ncbi:MAG: PilZ domain-containing protein [Terracidiphilus sp.]|jgi:hypothetical protein